MPHGAERGPLKGMERTCVRCSGLLWLRLFGHCKGGAGSAKKGTAALRRWTRLSDCVTVSQCCGEDFHFRVYDQFMDIHRKRNIYCEHASGKYVSC